MKFSRQILLASAAIIVAGVMPASAETITTKTVVHQKDMPNVEKTNFEAFDLNKDGVLSMSEVGEKLFYIFDTDGNDIIDNIEFSNKKVMTVIPMEKQVRTYVDYNNDGRVDEATVTDGTFLKQSRLMRFDDNQDGLSPADFIEHSFLDLDDDNSKAIELGEWKEAYTAMISPAAAEQERYNQ